MCNMLLLRITCMFATCYFYVLHVCLQHVTYSYMCNIPSCCGCSGRRRRGTDPWRISTKKDDQTEPLLAPLYRFQERNKNQFTKFVVFTISNFGWRTKRFFFSPINKNENFFDDVDEDDTWKMKKKTLLWRSTVKWTKNYISLQQLGGLFCDQQRGTKVGN